MVNVAGGVWCSSSGETFLHRDLHGCGNVTSTVDLAGLRACNAACRCRCRRGSDDTTDTRAEVTNIDSVWLCTIYCIFTFVSF